MLEVVVGNGVLLQELAHFHKRRLLEQLRGRLPGTTVTDLRFRAGAGQGQLKHRRNLPTAPNRAAGL